MEIVAVDAVEADLLCSGAVAVALQAVVAPRNENIAGLA